jgi:hypothetical protein
MQILRRATACVLTAAFLNVAVLSSVPVTAQQPVMERVEGDGGRYSFEIPKGYKSSTSPRPNGGTMRQHTYAWKDSVGQYNLVDFAVVDPPPGARKEIDIWQAQRMVSARYPGSLLSQAQEIQSGPAKGISFSMIVNSERGQGQHVVAMKLYTLDGRLYEMLSATRTEDRNDPTVVAFMNSFRAIR